jgi:S-DNA-T family DNA segregation ATPase FtsK/SpoIIIE
VVGFVTDLGGNLARRALISLNAEIHRREEILEHARAKDLPEMERRQHPDTPPNLLLVCDEFAALAKEIPEFVEGVVDVAQRGRSLGVHMILATQRPTGVVTPTIQANATLRIALRVAPGESSDVIGTADAEQIERSTPGRAFVRIGTRQPVQFQGAYVGGFTSGAGNEASVDLSWLEFEGLRPVEGTAGEAPPEHAATDLQRLVSTIRDAADRAGLPTPRSPLLDPLPPIVPLATLTADAGAHEAVLGLLDEPSEQRQRPALLDLDREGGLVVVGAGGAGKSGALRAFVADLSMRADPDELHVYAVDFGRSLAVLERLPTVGSVIAGDDTERVSRLFRMLRDTIDARGERFSSVSATTLTEYRRLRPADTDAARIVVVLDGWSGFNDTYNRAGFHHLEDGFPRLITDGRAVGVSFVLTADRLSTIPSAIRGVIPRLLALRQVNLDEYDAFGVRATKADLELPPGRGYYGGLEIQVPLVGDDASGEGQAASLAALGDALVERAGGRRAPVVGRLANVVDAADLPAAPGALVPVFAIDDAAFAPVSFDLVAFNLAVTGPLQSGRTTALATMVASLAPYHDDLALYLVAGRRRELVGAAPWRAVAVGADDALDLVSRLIEALDEGNLPPQGTLIVVDDMQELDDKPVDERLSTLLRRGRDEMVRAIVAAEIATFRRPSFDGLLKSLRSEGAVLFLQPGEDAGGRVAQVLPLGRRRFEPGRGFLVRRNATPALVQVAQPTPGHT